jgi:hypothetical protein
LLAEEGVRITFHPYRYGGPVKLTPIVKNKWSSGWADSWFYYRVPVHKTKVRGKAVYLLHSEMTTLDYVTKAPHNCSENDANAMAFEEAAKIIGGCNAIEEFLTNDIWPLSDDWDLEVERTEAPLLKVTVPMPKVAMMIGEQEMGAMFEMRIACTVNCLVGNYSRQSIVLVLVSFFGMAILIAFLNWLA